MAESKVSVNNFIGGLNTDHHELNTPQNVTVDEDNCDLDRKGSRRRRKGIDYETGYAFASTTIDGTLFSSFYFKTYEWEAVGNDPDVNFLVVQTGNTLSFFDMSYEPLSGGEKTFTVDLDDHLISGAATAAGDPIQVASAKGALFVTGRVCNPFFIEYDSGTDDITETEYAYEIRDFVQMENDSTLLEDRPAALTPEREYDLVNQGWDTEVAGNDSEFPGAFVTTGMTALDFYYSVEALYPPKTKPWWVGKRSAVDPGEGGYQIFDPHGVYDQASAGNTLAPLGHFILDPFNKDRSAVSGIGSFTVETKDTRPIAIAFHAGRLFYGHENNIYFSQTLNDDLLNAGKCYQAADPTAEDISDLVDTDGGVITLPSSSSIESLVSVENTLMILSHNGIWALSGSNPGDGFTATGFSVQKVSSIGLSSFRSLVKVEGNPVWWSKHGIFVLESNAVNGTFNVKNICQDKVQLFYDAIPETAKEDASGAYDKIKKVVTWIFRDTDAALHNNQYVCNRMLNLDSLVGAFFPYTLSDLDTNSPIVVDIFSVNKVNTQGAKLKFLTLISS